MKQLTTQKFNPAVLICSVFLFAFFADAQVPKNTFGIPTRLVLKGVGEPVPQKDDEYNRLATLTESFYPLGWSRDGKFAYFVEPPDEACGCYFSELVIQDMRTDKVLWKKKYSSEDLDEPDTMTLEKYWPTKQKEFEAKLNFYKIIPLKNAELLFPSINHEGDVLTPKMHVNIKTDDVYEVEGTATLKMTSAKKGSKTLYQQIYRKKDTNGFRAAEVSGILKSPFEPRVAVIVAQTIRGWEGPPHVIELKIAGADLTTGFRK